MEEAFLEEQLTFRAGLGGWAGSGEKKERWTCTRAGGMTGAHLNGSFWSEDQTDKLRVTSKTKLRT